MKKFGQIFVMTLIIMEVFLFFGGYILFDFYHNYYGAGVSCAFIAALVIYGFLVQAEKIEDLEKRIQILEEEKDKKN